MIISIPAGALAYLVYRGLQETGKAIQRYNAKKRKKSLEPINQKSLAILGPQGAGKTTLLRALGASIKYSNEGTTKQDYSSFTCTSNKGSVQICSGADYGGAVEYSNGDLGPELQDHLCKDIIFFLFDIHTFINNRMYAINVVKRLSPIVEHLNEKCLLDKIHLLATHSSKLDVSKFDAIKFIEQNFKGKNAELLLDSNIEVIELVDYHQATGFNELAVTQIKNIII